MTLTVERTAADQIRAMPGKHHSVRFGQTLHRDVRFQPFDHPVRDACHVPRLTPRGIGVCA